MQFCIYGCSLFLVLPAQSRNPLRGRFAGQINGASHKDRPLLRALRFENPVALGPTSGKGAIPARVIFSIRETCLFVRDKTPASYEQ